MRNKKTYRMSVSVERGGAYFGKLQKSTYSCKNSQGNNNPIEENTQDKS